MDAHILVPMMEQADVGVIQAWIWCFVDACEFPIAPWAVQVMRSFSKRYFTKRVVHGVG
jgi:hypothetical protein